MLSVVIICKNEERFIGQCIESVLAATANIGNCEVVIVDSSSEDRTIEVANKYPVTIFQLGRNQRHTPAAGRHIGFLRTSRQYVLFLDGDSFLVKGFVEEAIRCFKNNSTVAAIIGKRLEVYYDYSWKRIPGEEIDANHIGDSPRFIMVAQASAIYLRSALDKVGGFNPYLFSEEEAELSDRIRNHGMKILGIPVDMVVHNTFPREQIKTHFERMKSNLHLGPGQVLRYRIKNGISASLLRRISSGLYMLSWLSLAVMSIFAAGIFGKVTLVIGWLLASLALYGIMIIKQSSIVKPLQYIFLSSVQAYALIRGFLMRPLAPNTYPTDVIIIKDSTTTMTGGRSAYP